MFQVNLGYGQVYSIESHGGVMSMAYEVIIGVMSWLCVYVNKFENRGKVIPYKHLNFIYRIRMFCDLRTNDFIMNQRMSVNKVKKLLQQNITLG